MLPVARVNNERIFLPTPVTMPEISPHYEPKRVGNGKARKLFS